MNKRKQKQPTEFGKTKNIGRYQKICKLGKGTYGQVFKVIDTELNRKFAMKKSLIEIRPEGIPPSMLREINLLRSLDHPNIVKLLDVVYTQVSIYCIFELGQQDLYRWLQSRKVISKEIIAFIIFQCLEGLNYCHENRIIHRDLKPQNIIISNDFQIKICDFGLAKAFLLPSEAKPSTPQVQTLWYRAPELILGDSNYDNRVDIWSLGCVLAEMLLGLPLFTANSNIDLLYRIFNLRGKPNQTTYKDVTNLPNWSDRFPSWEPCDLKTQFNIKDDDIADLLDLMLKVNPQERISAEEAMRHRFFHCIRGNILS